MYNILLMVQIVVALGIISLVLVQHGKGADAGAAFGGGGAAGGASGSVFGSRGAGNFLSRTTAILALVFFMNSLGLAWLVSHRDGNGNSIISDSVTPVTETVSDVAGDVPEVPDSGSAVKADGDVPEASAETKAPAPSSDNVPEANDVPEVTTTSTATTSSTDSVPGAAASTSAPSTDEKADAAPTDANDKSTKE